MSNTASLLAAINAPNRKSQFEKIINTEFAGQITLAKIKDFYADDWAEIEADASGDTLRACCAAYSDMLLMERGAIPGHYTAETFCICCNATVPIFDGGDDRVQNCPWCYYGLPFRTITDGDSDGIKNI